MEVRVLKEKIIILKNVFFYIGLVYIFEDLKKLVGLLVFLEIVNVEKNIVNRSVKIF